MRNGDYYLVSRRGVGSWGDSNYVGLLRRVIITLEEVVDVSGVGITVVMGIIGGGRKEYWNGSGR